MKNAAQAAKPTRERKPENLFQRGKVWWIRYNVNGEKIRRSLDTTSLREAKRLRDQILGKRSAAAKFGLEPPVPRKEPTFREVCELWQKSRKARSDLRASSLHQSEWVTKEWLLPSFGNMRMSEIDAEEVEHFIGHLQSAKSKRTGKPLSKASIAHIIGGLKTVYKQAAKRSWYIGLNPIDRLDRLPSRGLGRDTTLLVDEAIRLLNRLSGATYYKVALALATGLRWGEVHGLAWDDIVLDAEIPTLTVRRSYTEEPKTEASAATIPLSTNAVALLRQWKAELGDEAVYVFPTRRGELHKREMPSEMRRIKKAAVKAGITKRIHPHVFRHTFGTWVYEQTSDLKSVQRLMRHASFQSTLIYVHDRRELGSVVNKLPVLTERKLMAV